MRKTAFFLSTLLATALLLLNGCGSSSTRSSATTDRSLEESTDFNLQFKALSFGQSIDCDTELLGFGPDGQDRIAINDLRFFVSNLTFYNEANEEIPLSLNDNEFHYKNDSGEVSLIDLTSNSSGSCTSDALAFSEGTARTNDSIQGTVDNQHIITSISFDVGVPQALMQSIITTHSTEDTPSPLSELYWSWASGYRHFVTNFSIHNASGDNGEGYLHIGSRGCGGSGLLALENKDACDLLNTAKVVLNNFDPTTNTVVIHLNKALKGLSFVASIHDSEPPHDVIGESPGVSCHSGSAEQQPDCPIIFDNFGLNPATGAANAELNAVFGMQ